MRLYSAGKSIQFSIPPSAQLSRCSRGDCLHCVEQVLLQEGQHIFFFPMQYQIYCWEKQNGSFGSSLLGFTYIRALNIKYGFNMGNTSKWHTQEKKNIHFFSGTTICFRNLPWLTHNHISIGRFAFRSCISLLKQESEVQFTKYVHHV